ncbi:hypothetical protein GsuE55_32700 [Geobacillus subterraneus]|uniref:Uncharacterized protein n=1 Tax=Geobacillus subterraneus TaxID=129338 RepID=A0A679FW33_9BACL|nr:hypothetical protein GsuE55_00060 [Geobacillus subterraneus]BBW97926.1 hypothetical protein GsuE55_27590 [Geobacillus subterraneus]BBW98437.1 hypothetical protein GsuE55_32700 [Geobacillus subterraneus]
MKRRGIENANPAKQRMSLTHVTGLLRLMNQQFFEHRFEETHCFFVKPLIEPFRTQRGVLLKS